MACWGIGHARACVGVALRELFAGHREAPKIGGTDLQTEPVVVSALMVRRRCQGCEVAGRVLGVRGARGTMCKGANLCCARGVGDCGCLARSEMERKKLK